MSSPESSTPARLILDSGPLGRLSSPNAASPVNRTITEWLRDHLAGGTKVYLSEVCDYEVRRELLQASRIHGLQRLDGLRNRLIYVPLDTQTMRRAAEMWADARRHGMPTADRKELDFDVILAAQAESAGAVMVTENVGHLARLVTAKHWRDIPAP